MQYFFDFDRTVFDTESFKRAYAKRPTAHELFHQAKVVLKEFFSSSSSLPKRRIFTRMLGTFLSHRRFGFLPEELKEYLYPDAAAFLAAHSKDCTIVTYGVRAFITAKVANALTSYPLGDIVYTPRKKGRTLRRLIEGKEGPFIFVDDAHFQLESVGEVCPEIELYEIRRDDGAGDGRWPVIRSFEELPGHAPAPIDFSTARVAAILNTASGSCDTTAEQMVQTLLTEAGVTEPRVWCGDGSYMGIAFKEMKAYDPDVLIVLGGDGTIRAGAEACTSVRPLLVPLPGGTMNMLPKALYGALSWQDALKGVLHNPKVRNVSGGSIKGRQFFIAAIIGAPTLWAKAREALREGDLSGVVEKGMHAFQNMLSLKIRYSFSKAESGETDAVSVICPLISDIMEDTEQSLEAAVIDVENAGGVLELASAAAFGKWRESARVTTVKTRTIKVSADEDIPVILDGETMDLGNELEITFVPIAFKALVHAV
ncbi:MAG: diacylglycerol kinase family protein [Patescibacteria group bacterium]